MKLVQIVLLLGQQCVSPIEQTPGVTDVARVPCAIVIERQTDTGRVEVKPASQAGNPVVAILSERQTLVSMDGKRKSEVKTAASVVDHDVFIPRPQPRPRLAASRQTRDVRALKIAPKAATPKAAGKKSVKKAAATKRTDRCGSMRAAWYTTKQGHRRYRCVK